MTFQVKSSKTKSAKTERVRVDTPPKADITPISIEAMVTTAPKGTCYFKRLKYKGCPKIASGGHYRGKGKFYPYTELVDMQRDDFIRQMYGLFTDEGIDLSPNTTFSFFNQFTHYVSTLDEAGRDVDLSKANIDWYMARILAKQRKGIISKGTLSNRKKGISFLLKQLGRYQEARDLPSVKGTRKATQHTEPMNDNDHTDCNKILLMAYTAYVRCLIEGKAPEYCPIFNERLLRSLKSSDGSPRYSDKEINRFRTSAKQRINSGGDWRNMLTRIVFLLIARPSGANLSPLANLKRKHVNLRKLEGDRWVFDLDSIKGRAQYEQQLIQIGFTTHTKELLEGWLQNSARFTQSKDDFLFPLFDRNGQLKHIGRQPQTPVNKALKPYELPPIHCKGLRATRSSKYLRATGDYVGAADANRNAVPTTETSYSGISKQTKEIELAGALIAQGKIVSGTDKRTAIDEAKASFKDPLSDYEYRKKMRKSANKTTTGVRCGDPHGDKAKKSMRKYAKIVNELDSTEEVDTCIDFLECFGCPSHVLISEVDDIWLMLSFKDSIITSLSRPSFNSTPSDYLGNLLIKVEAALELLKEDSPANHAKAQAKNDDEPHPLYDDEYAFEDMIGIYS